MVWLDLELTRPLMNSLSKQYFTKGVSYRKHCLQLHLFFSETIVKGSNNYARNFFLPESQCVFTPFIYKFCTSQRQKIQAWSIVFRFQPFWISSKQIFLWDMFCHKVIPNKADFAFTEKRILKIKFILYFLKRFNLLIEWPSYVDTYI